MKTYKIFEAKELEEALEEKGLDGDMLFDLFNNFCNDVAVHWWVELPSITPEDSVYEKAINIVNEYMINQGCASDEKVYIDVTW